MTPDQEPETTEAFTTEDLDPTTDDLAPGIYVLMNDAHTGPYLTTEDAQLFIDGHLNGQGEIVTIEG